LFSKLERPLKHPPTEEKTMQIRRTSVTALALTLLFALSTTAVGQAGTNCDPGQIMTPCSAVLEATNTGETMTPPAGALGEIETPPAPRDEAYMTEIASSVLFSILSLF
jgi:hypothetical protein